MPIDPLKETNLEKPGVKTALLRELAKVGRDKEAKAFRVKTFYKLCKQMERAKANKTSWEEMALTYRVYLLEGINVKEDAKPQGEQWDSKAARTEFEDSFGLLPKDWPALPATAPWLKELEWAYQNGFFVIAEKPTGAVSYRWSRARTPAPSQGALVLMKLQAESRQKFMDLLGKAKAGGADAEADGVRRERRRVDEIVAMLEKLDERKRVLDEEKKKEKDEQNANMENVST